MRVAVIGGGINGVMSAYALANRGHQVDLFERGKLMSETSRASTKLLHGGLRYLEHGALRLVRESLHERAWWLTNAPALARPIQILIPVYASGRRGRTKLAVGLALYAFLAGHRKLGRHRWLNARQTISTCPTLRRDGLRGAYSFWDAQMDDSALGMWAAGQAATAGAALHEHAQVTNVTTSGCLSVAGADLTFERIVNAAGPWASQLLRESGVRSRFELDLVRGSHLLLSGPQVPGLLVESPSDGRPVFILPYQGATLVGTTEVRQSGHLQPVCTDAERDYLLEAFNVAIDAPRSQADISMTFAGLRPLLAGAALPSSASREYAIERTGRLINVFGGKWTTAHALGEKVAAATET